MPACRQVPKTQVLLQSFVFITDGQRLNPSLRRRGAGLGVQFSSPSPSHVVPYRVKAGPRGAARRSWCWAARKQSADRARKRCPRVQWQGGAEGSEEDQNLGVTGGDG
ncbi:uncharacterized protein [Miscanthus floridulus]|uniref:uncharacterized protein isoform X3 n=1 Tax=Miscanthus floridulus TaxID=154761 RepID=UPI00345A0841